MERNKGSGIKSVSWWLSQSPSIYLMENYSYNSYPESGESSPRSREIEFENPSPWEDHSQAYKVKLMCSYGGKIHPRPHDNQLSYLGGDTKILAVDRNIKFSSIISKLSSLSGEPDVSFKYQLPDQDLDALISVTNDDDLEHMMQEYDRLHRASAKPARMRLFLFPVPPSPAASFSSDTARVEPFNSIPTQENIKPPPQNNVDLLFGLEKGAPQPPKVPEFHVASPHQDRLAQQQLNLQTHLQSLQISDQQQHQPMYTKTTDDNFVPAGANAGYGGSGDYYVQKLPEKTVPPPNIPQQVSAPPGYWPEKQVSGGFHAPVTATTVPSEHPPVYMIPATHGAVYHHNVNPVVRPVTGQGGQGYYVQRMGGAGSGHEVYREQQVYNMVPPPQQQGAVNTMGMVRPSVGPGGGVTDTGYAPVAYDNAGGRQVFYTAPGGVVHQPPAPQVAQQYQGVVGVSGEMRGAVGGLPIAGGQEAKVVTSKISQTSM